MTDESHFWDYEAPKISALLAPFERLEDVGPQLIRFAEVVGQTYVCHTGLWATAHGFELRDDVFEAECFAYGLCNTRFELDVNNVDVEMIVSGLICSLISESIS